MAALNRRAAELMRETETHACTDVTGFGLAGHLGAMAAASGVDVEVICDDLPLLPGVVECLAAEILPGAIERNRESSAGCLVFDGPPPALLDIFFDPQTSGGLLIAVAPSAAESFLARLHEEGIAEAARIGRVSGPGTGRVFVRDEGRRPVPVAPQPPQGPSPSAASHDNMESMPQSGKASSMQCCEHVSGGPLSAGEPGAAAGVAGLQQKFHEFLKAAGAPGALDGRTKQAIALALSVLARCGPCVKAHIKKAQEMGFSQEEIDEAAWLAIAFGGSPTMLFYQGVRTG
jgi:AhpD family alkylhydroperoxidase